MRLSIFSLLFLICGTVFSQSSDLKLANKYAKESDCEKAIELYKTLNSNINIASYYSNYQKCLIQLEEYNKAILLTKKLINKFPKESKYVAELGFIYQLRGDDQKAEKQFKRSIELLPENRVSKVSVLANVFYKYKNYKWVLKTYEKGQLLNPLHDFAFNIASLYRTMGETSKMIDAYIELIEKNPANYRNAQINLQNSLGRTKGETDNFSLLRKKLLARIQKTNNVKLTELLVWLFMQSDDYELAFKYTKAIDKRLQENGIRIYELGRIAQENETFTTAIKCYDYIILKGKNNPNYFNSKIQRLIAKSQNIINNQNKEEDLIALNTEYENLFLELGKTKQTALLIKKQAYLEAFYLRNYFKAKALLQECINVTDSKRLIAECKLMLADIHLIEGENWEAIIVYSQVEKENKENPLGHEAKFKRAKISYYQGQFDWAQAQLDVLKASTTKLIANNAMQLSLLITDNMGLDTSAIAMQTFARAELLEYQNKKDQCLNSLDSMLINFEGHTLIDEILFKQAKILEQQKKIHDAIIKYEKIIAEFNFDILADDAIYFLAKLYQNELKDFQKSIALYEKILLDHNGSIYTDDARKQFRKLRGDNLTEPL